ncbi:MAG: aminoglycoside 3'-phosphotransferase [Treponema sp.]|nr:aminoglycoside 3'-phosphotransferase [Treponema sp.]
MENNNWPYKIRDKIKNMEIKENKVGCSTANLYKCVSNTENYYLKIDSKNGELKSEYQNISWLCGKIPVPKIIEWVSDEEADYLLISEINGLMLCDDYYLANPYLAVSVLSKGLQLLHSIDIRNCNIKNNLDKKLLLAKNNVQSNRVDINDWEEETKRLFQSPGLLLEYLYDNKPQNEELVFTHGDYCLPNILGNGSEITGFIDLGRSGISDKWQDIALCIRSLCYNFHTNEYENILLEKLGIEKDTIKFNYYILLDELF